MAYIYASLSTILSTSSAINELPSYSDITPDALSDYFVVDSPTNLGVYKTQKLTYGLLRDIILYDILSQTPLTYSLDIATNYSVNFPINTSVIGTLSSLEQRVTYMENRTAGLLFGTLTLSSHAYLALSGADKKVGIGTSTPNEKLTVNGNISATGSTYVRDLTVKGDSSIPTDGYIDIKGPSTTNNLRLQQTNGGLSIFTNNENAVAKVKLDYLGNLAINTDPDTLYKLKVSGKTNITNGDLKVSNGDVVIDAPNKFIGYGTIPVGGIIMWSGSIVSIPSGWSLCDGTNGTPDLRNRFIAGAGDSYSPGNTGGVEENTLNSSHIPRHTHDVIDPGHRHRVVRVKGSDAGASSTDGGDVEWSEGFPSEYIYTDVIKTGIKIKEAGSDMDPPSLENRPPYYALAFIMRTL
jgi:hypothetical protein